MPCLFAIFALLTPRLLIFILWLFTDWFKGLFDFALWPILGFFFLPSSLLWYSAVQHWWGGEWGILTTVGMVIAVMIDMSPASGRRKKKRRKSDD